MKKIAAILIGLIVLLAPAAVLAAPAAQFSATFNSACNDPVTSQSDLCKGQNSSGNPVSGNNGILLKAVRIISLIAGVVAVIMIMVGGFRYIISNGDSAAVNNAKNTILYAVIGLIIVVSAQFIISFVINNI